MVQQTKFLDISGITRTWNDPILDFFVGVFCLFHTIWYILFAGLYPN